MKSKLGQNKWIALLAVTLSYSFAFLTRYIWSPVMTDAGAEFGINSTQMGLYMTAFMIGYLIMQIPGGILADRLRPKYLLLVSVCVAAVCSGLFSVSTSVGVGIALRAVEGLSLGGIYSSCSKIVSMYFAPKERAVAMGILLASPPLGILLANSLGEPLNEAFGWRMTIRIVAYIGVAVLALLLLAVKSGERPTADAHKGGMFDGTKLYFRDKQQVILAVGAMLSQFGTVGFATWMNTYMKTDLGFPGVKGGMLLTVYSLVGIAATCFSGAIVRRFGWDQRRFLIVMYALAACCTLVFAFLRSYAALMCVGIAYGVVVNLASAHMADLCIRRAPGQHIATMCALMNLIMQVGPMLQSYIIGAAADATGSYHVMWWIFTAAGALSVILMAMFDTNKPVV